MSDNCPVEITAKTSRRRFDGRISLRAVALTAAVAGAVGSVGLMLLAGHPPVLLRILFSIWVLSPFIAFILADVVGKGWSAITRMTLHCVMLVVTLISLALYVNTVLRPPESTPAYMFVVVPLGSWILMLVVVPIAAMIAHRRS
jgi:hypothetical protein